MTPGDPSVRGPDDTMATRRGEALVSMLIVALVVLFALGRQWWRVLASSPTQARCEQLAERYVEQASRARYEDVDARAIAEAQAQRGELRIGDVLRCQEELTDAQVSCGLVAANVDEIERCLQP